MRVTGDTHVSFYPPSTFLYDEAVVRHFIKIHLSSKQRRCYFGSVGARMKLSRQLLVRIPEYKIWSSLGNEAGRQAGRQIRPFSVFTHPMHLLPGAHVKLKPGRSRPQQQCTGTLNFAVYSGLPCSNLDLDNSDYPDRGFSLFPFVLPGICRHSSLNRPQPFPNPSQLSL
jgi:hypothetical protein